MRKVVVHTAGGYDRLRVEEHVDPAPGPGEVAIRVAASGVNYADCIVRMGLYESAKKLVGWPITPGFEVSGNIAAVGEGVTSLAPGDRVVAVTLFGGYASRVVVPAHQAFRISEALEFADAAAFPAVFLTAWYALFELCKLRPGMQILVHSAAGGVGSALLQLARVAGCVPTAVVGSTHKVDAAMALGAEHVIDKSVDDLWKRAESIAPDGFDVVLDANGVETLKGSYRHLGPCGRLVVYGFHTMLPKVGGRPSWLKLGVDYLRTPRFSPLALCDENCSVMAFNLSYLFSRRELLEEGMSWVLALIDGGRVKLPRVTRYAFDDVGEAHRALESGTTVGKLVLTSGG